MVAHIIFCVVFGLLMLTERTNNKFDNRLISGFKISIFIVILYYMLSSPFWGVDQEEYYSYFYIGSKENSFISFFNEPYSAAFHIICKILCYISWDFWSFRIELFLIQFLIVAYMINKYSEYKILSIFAYVTINASLVFFCERQMTAFAFFLIAWELKNNKKYIASLLFMLFAIAIHQIAIVGVGIYVIGLFHERFSKIKLVVFATLLSLIATSIINFIIENYKNGIYIDIDYEKGGLKLFILLTAIIFFIDFLLDNNMNSFKINYTYNLYAVAWLLQILAMQLSVLNRSRIFYSWTLVILISEICVKNRMFKNKSVLKFGIWIILSVYFLFVFASKYPYILNV